jgi:hypothetical protein
MKNNKKIFIKLHFLIFMIVLFSTSTIFSQYQIKWMSVGSLHNWYSEIGSEIEEGFVKEQQYGLQWPAIYAYQDIQAAKAFWIGATNFLNLAESQDVYAHKVVHVGPRVTGSNEFFPMGFKMISKFDPPKVYVDGEETYDKSVNNDEVDPNLFTDRMIVNEDNTQLGISVTRKIFQFSQQYHDNYIVTEYTFRNTGNVNDDSNIELPNNTLTGVYFYFQYRLAVCANTRYVIGNATGWGINSMLDTRGDGVKVDPPDQNFRAQYMWQGKYPPFQGSGFVTDNIGGPIFTSAINVEAGDTVGRLGAYQFAGVVTLHADVSATDHNDDLSQPSTTSYRGSDEPNTSNNDAFNRTKMTSEYGWMSSGHMSPRHADLVGPDGDPSLGTPGGFSMANGYGPYTLAPGDSVKIVIAEAVSGISRELATTTGIKYKKGQITAAEKNAVVYQSRDSLFQTFRRAIANYQSGYQIPEPPLPPKTFDVNGLGDRIELTWDTYDNPGDNLEGFEIYRAVGKPDSNYYLIYRAGVAERSYNDVTAIRGLNYYYYIVSVGTASSNTGVGLTPSGSLKSSRYYTQTYNPATLKRKAGTDMDSIRVVPNPYNIGASKELGYGEQANDRLYFFNIPGRCNINIYTELGELIATLNHTDGSGDEAWDSITSSGQIVVSGIYIAVIDNLDTGQKKIVKFVIIR